MPPPPHSGWPKITFKRISRHFRSIRNFFFHKMAAGGHFGWPKITFDRISRHFRSIRNLFVLILFTKWLPAAILDDRKSPSIAFVAISDQYATLILFTKWLPAAILDDRKSLSIAFIAISDQYETFFFEFFSQNGCRRPFWMTEVHFQWNFSSFQINMQLLFCLILFTKWLPAAILEYWKSLLIAFLAISDQYATLFFLRFCSQNGCGGHFGWDVRGHFVFPIDAKNHKVLVIWDLNGYGEYEFDWCICDQVMISYVRWFIGDFTLTPQYFE